MSRRTVASAVVVAVTVAVVASIYLAVRPRDESPDRSATPPAGPTSGPPFTDVTAAAGIDFTHESGARGEKLNPETFGPGAGWFDHDGDGLLDLLLVNGNVLRGEPDPAARSKLYRNLGDGRFEDVTAAAGLDVAFYGMGFAAADIEGDGDQDLFLYGLHRAFLFENVGGGRFRDATAGSGLDGLDGWICAAAFLDYDRDGSLDLFVGNYVEWRPDSEDDLDCRFGTPSKKYCPVSMFAATAPQLFRGRGDGVFEETTGRAGLAGLRGKALGVAVEDHDRDGDPDIFVANDSVPNFLLENRGDGTFVERGIESGFATDADGAALAGMGIDTVWTDDDGPLLVAIGNFSGEPTTVHEQDQVDYFVERSFAVAVGGPTIESVTFGLLLRDLDLDGQVDLVMANGHVYDVEAITGSPYRQRAQLFLGRDGSRFVEAPPSPGDGLLGPRLLGRALACADHDGDGDLDLVITENQGRARLLRNDLDGTRRFVRVELAGSGRNRDAIGAEVVLVSETGGVTRRVRRTRSAASSYLSVSEPAITFGLRDGETPRRLDVRWPSGLLEAFAPSPVEGRVVLVEGAGEPLSLGDAPAVAAGGPSSVAVRRRGLDQLAAGRLADALASLEEAISLDPHDFVAHRGRLIALRRLGRRERVAAALDEIVERFPSASLLVSHFALVLRESGHRDLAELVFQRAAALDPARPDVWLDLGNLAFDRGDTALARRRYAEVLKRNAESLEALSNTAKTLLIEKDIAGAREYLERALAIGPQHPPALCDMGGVLIEEGDLDAAERMLTRALDLDPGRDTLISIHGNLGILHFKRRDRARAIESFERVLELDPDDAQARRVLERLRDR